MSSFSLFGGMRAAVSGLFAQSQSLGMIGDNIANVNTHGYKAVRNRFSSLVTTASNQTTHSPGGVQSNVLRGVDQQGLLEAASSSTDLAISGNGMFAVNAEADSSGEYLFTRAGSFRADLDGNLVNAGGYYLLGFPVTNQVPQETNILTELEVVNISDNVGVPAETTTIDLGANLKASAATGDTFDLGIQVIDKQGTPETLTLTFTKNATVNTWDITAAVTNASFVNTASSALLTGTQALGQVVFNADGTLDSTNLTSQTIDTALTTDVDGFTFSLDFDNDFATGTSEDRTSITLDLGTVDTALGLHQFEGVYTPNYINQDGRQFGAITGVSVADDGVVTAQFDNGELRVVSQVPIVTFANPNELTEETGNVYKQNAESGSALIKTANSGGAGLIQANALEASTVDLADEFTRMIMTQRAFSANTRMITTGDEMLEELVRSVR